MMNADPAPLASEGTAAQDEAVHDIVHAGAGGALLLAGAAVAVVIGLWFVFYFLVFLPRAVGA